MKGREVRALSYLPHALIATAMVVAFPTLLAIAVDGRYPRAASVAMGVLVSLGFSRLGALVWNRLPGARELEFSEVILWNWIRLLQAERRLARTARALGLDEQGNGMDQATIGVEERKRLLLELNSALEAKDPYTLGHTRRVARYSYWIAVKMGLDPDEVRAIRFAADVHDVGKIKVPDSILRKPARLTEDEFEIMKGHSAAGAEMVAALGDDRITSIIRGHHERWDGGGYPDGIAGEAIPLGARIMAVADTYDAITTSRCYRRKSNHEKAVAILREEAGKQFDEHAVEAFLSHRHHRSTRLVALLATGPWRLLEWVVSGLRYGASAGLAQAGAVAMAASLIAGAAVGGSPADGAVRRGRAAKPAAATAGSPTGGSLVATSPSSTDGGKRSAGPGGSGGPKDRVRIEGASGGPTTSEPDLEDDAAAAPGGPGGGEPEPDGAEASVGSGGHDGADQNEDASPAEDDAGTVDEPDGSGSGGVVDDVGETVDDAVDDVGDAVDDVGDTVDDAVDDVGDTVDEVVDDVQDTVDDVVGGLGLP